MRTLSVHIIHFVLMVLCLVSCSKGEIQDCQCTREELQGLFEEGHFIDSVVKENNRIWILFSGGRKIACSWNNVDIFTIGLNGYWFKNDQQTPYLTSKSLNSLLSVQNGEDDRLSAIGEGYEDWTFYFGLQQPVVIKKPVYSRDFDERILSFNHRGYSASAPENTLPAFRLSRLNGFRYVETDVRFTSDGVPVLLHDSGIDRTSNGNGSIDKMSFDQVRKYDFGSWKSKDYEGTRIPSLEEFLALCCDLDIHPVLELKCGGDEQITCIVEMVKKFGLLEDTIFISFSLSSLNLVLERAPSSSVGYLVSEITNDVIQNTLNLKTQFNRVALDSRDYKESALVMCQKAGIPLWVWTINSKDAVCSLNPYITAITSDFFHAGRVLSGFE